MDGVAEVVLSYTFYRQKAVAAQANAGTDEPTKQKL